MNPSLPLLLLSLLLLLSPAAAAEQPSVALVAVEVRSPAAVERLAATGVPVYARLTAPAGEVMLAGADVRAQAQLRAAGLPFRALDADMAGAEYFVAYPAPGRSVPWAAYGRLLYADGRQAVLRSTASAVQRLQAEGVKVVPIGREPLPLLRRTAAGAAGAFADLSQPDPLVQAMVAQVSQATVYQYTGDLSGEWPVVVEGAPYTITTRNTLSGEPVRKATRYVGEHLAALGLSVEYHTYRTAWPPNVIGELRGVASPGTIYIVGGHLDNMPPSGRAPGADDNASGAVGTLIAADILSQYQWDCTLRFVFWTGEEQGLIGSDAYARRASQRNENILGVINLDMIGWNTPGSPPDIDLHANANLPATLDLADLFADVIAAYGLDLIPQIVPDGTGASDHASFWSRGYTAILGIEDYRGSPNDFNPYYHTSNDQLSRLDMAYFTDFVRAAVAATAHMSNCLRTGRLQGQVTASHDGSPIAAATVAVTRTVGYQGQVAADGAGHYATTVPAGSFAARASAYGYLPADVAGLTVGGGAVVTQNFVLTAAPPQAPAVAIGGSGGAINLAWAHVSPNMAYQVHRGESPYFTAEGSTQRAGFNLPFPNPVTYSDPASGLGNPLVNHFYVVLGVNAAGATVASQRVGEFDFALAPGG
ncbi:MAG: M20/M25/M40 family metallo-hydrolase [Caldilineales bacterium]|nr:M20/M25/M40 family metallo-hydrolase [Caldilineales bacterium]MDW8317209.1 M20/M25/M40 family metallo-hydrolase [Anaerolineae bacterium]